MTVVTTMSHGLPLRCAACGVMPHDYPYLHYKAIILCGECCRAIKGDITHIVGVQDLKQKHQ